VRILPHVSRIISDASAMSASSRYSVVMRRPRRARDRPGSPRAAGDQARDQLVADLHRAEPPAAAREGLDFKQAQDDVVLPPKRRVGRLSRGARPVSVAARAGGLPVSRRQEFGVAGGADAQGHRRGGRRSCCIAAEQRHLDRQTTHAQ
jgi:hypothetical protein